MAIEQRCKLTTKERTTHGGFPWEIGKWEEIDPASEGGLCSHAYFHFYRHPLVAAFFNPIHANFKEPVCWSAEVDGALLHEGDKSGAKRMRILEEIPLPAMTLTQRVAAAILCGKEVYADPEWNKWADDWLSGKDRSKTAAEEAAAEAAAWAAEAKNEPSLDLVAILEEALNY